MKFIRVFCLAVSAFCTFAVSGLHSAASSTCTTSVQSGGSENKDIPVATAQGIVCMSRAQYEFHILGAGELPNLSTFFVFGRSIPQPATDEFGHILIYSGTNEKADQFHMNNKPHYSPLAREKR